VNRDVLLPVSAEVGKAAGRQDAVPRSDESGRRLGASLAGQRAEPGRAQAAEQAFARATPQRVSARPEPTVQRRPGGRSPVLPAEPGALPQVHRVERFVLQERRPTRSQPLEPKGESVSPVSVVRRPVSLGEQRLPLPVA